MSGGVLATSVLCAVVSGHSRLTDKLGEAEARHAVERCLHRMERAVAGQKGRIGQSANSTLIAFFDSAEAAKLAAREMQQRVADLPPVSGIVLSIRVACHHGPLSDGPDGLLGNTVKTAVRIAESTRAGETGFSSEAVAQLPPIHREQMKSIDARSIVVSDGTIRLWIVDNDPTAGGAHDQSLTLAAEVRLWLRHRGKEVVLGPDRPTAILGRDSQADIVVLDSRASRTHGRIELRRDTFVLVDQSTNGTYVSFAEEAESQVRHNEIPLRGTGYISFGHSHESAGQEILEFRILDKD